MVTNEEKTKMEIEELGMLTGIQYQVNQEFVELLTALEKILLHVLSAEQKKQFYQELIMIRTNINIITNDIKNQEKRLQILNDLV